MAESIVEEHINIIAYKSERQLSKGLEYRCINYEWGCHFVGTYENVEKHQLRCTEDFDDCPLAEFCHFRNMPEREFIKHVAKIHPGLKFATNGNCARWECFRYRSCMTDSLKVIILAFNQLFYCYAEIDRSIVKWIVYFLGNAREATNYHYQIEFEGHRVNSPCYLLRRACVPFSGSNYQCIDKNNCVIVYKEMLKLFCDSYVDELLYYINIIQVKK